MLHTIECPTAGAALWLSLLLDQEAPSVWAVQEGKPVVHTMADLDTIKATIGLGNRAVGA